ncbi:MAG TPA: carboxypeptidase-like regulatory domain-containing protein, partial [Pyrinomonadaceae bacterium]|nr:carboxypeptidase-like regulatory domain-containing protein [Pyrinomonadaceae bacterium]
MKNLAERLAFAPVFVLMCGVFFAASGQDLDEVTITGRITDPNGVAVAGAAVKATHSDTGAERTAVTDNDGRYKLIELKPGVYKITATQTGFGPKERSALETVSGQTVNVDFQLAPAGVMAGTDVTVSDE